ncbi:hypothetical protein OGAPHI_005670 [Ogataea philodendri]|uniref:RRM domain-containing protein n=1 Tax=Ogataea philodendri TaxID=1378263 RepID=A0A9P8T153_9ASCO|nr:uncharacterized protein OGAPHI_005670 [Ogataea philodendri]KAH3662418.1 hypothetical protein OGAPHI_005670 [Ogataea philodendri]
MLQDQAHRPPHPRQLSRHPSLNLSTAQNQVPMLPAIYPPQYHSYSQLPNGAQIINVPMPQQVPLSPTTPFDVNYAKGMLPRQLLISSPFIQSPMGPASTPHTQNAPQTPNGERMLQRHTQLVNADQYYTRSPQKGGQRRSSFSKLLKSKLSNVNKAPKVLSESESLEIEPSEPETRSLRFINLRPDFELPDFLDLIEYGPIENCSFELPKQSTSSKSVILSFVETETAKKCYVKLNSIIDELRSVLESPDMEIVYAKAMPLLPAVEWAIENDGATRAVCLTNIQPGLPLKMISQELEQIGPVEQIKYIPNKYAAFVHFTSISTAIKCVEQLALSESILSTCKVFYSKEKNATPSQSNGNSTLDLEYEDPNQYSDFYSTPSTSMSSPQNSGVQIHKSSSRQLNDTSSSYSHQYVHQYHTPVLHSSYPPQNEAVDSYGGMMYSHPSLGESTVYSNGSAGTYSPPLNDTMDTLSVISRPQLRQSNFGNRTVYLGNIHPETTAEEVCNTARGGLLESVKLIPDKRICFLTFADSASAAQFFAAGTKDKVTIHGRRVKVDWGKHSGPLDPEIADAIEKHGASRNLYIGTEPRPEGDEEDLTDRPVIPDADTLRKDFSIFGEVEQINFFRDGQCAFVNFLNIMSCINAVEDFNGPGSDAVHTSFENKYKPFKISFGKDRCANPPKTKKHQKRRNKKRREAEEPSKNVKASSEGTAVPDTDTLLKVPALKSIGISSKMYEEKRSSVLPVTEKITGEDSSTDVMDKELKPLVREVSALSVEEPSVKPPVSIPESDISYSSSDDIPKSSPRMTRKTGHPQQRPRLPTSFSRSSSTNSINYFNHADHYAPQQAVQYHPVYQQASPMYQKTYAYPYSQAQIQGHPRISRTNSRKTLHHEPASPASGQYVYMQQGMRPAGHQPVYYNYPDYYNYGYPQADFFMEGHEEEELDHSDGSFREEAVQD